jgi:hypothetical protein
MTSGGTSPSRAVYISWKYKCHLFGQAAIHILKGFPTMNRTKQRFLSILLAIAFLMLPTAAVHAKELGMLTISGPGIQGELALTGPETWGRLEDSGFFVQENFIQQAPENLGQGYTLTAGLNLDGTIAPFVIMEYYPAEQGQSGYFHYTARSDGQALQPIDQWGISSRQGDKAFRALMGANHIAVQSAILAMPETQPGSSPAAPVSPLQVPSLILMATVACLAVLGGARILRRRAAGRRNA